VQVATISSCLARLQPWNDSGDPENRQIRPVDFLHSLRSDGTVPLFSIGSGRRFFEQFPQVPATGFTQPCEKLTGC